MSNIKRKLVDITLEEAVEVMKLGEGFDEGVNYQLRKGINPQNIQFAQLYYHWINEKRINEEIIAANFSDTKDAVILCHGNKYYRTHYRIIKYLEKRGFGLESADSRH